MNAASTPMAHINLPQTQPSPTPLSSHSNQLDKQQTGLAAGSSYIDPNNKSSRSSNTPEYPDVRNQYSFIDPNLKFSNSFSSNSNQSNQSFRLSEKINFTESNLRGGDSPIIPNSSGSVPNEVTEISFYDSNEPISIRAGRLIASAPLSLSSLIQRDPFLRVTLLKMRKERNNLAPISHLNFKPEELLKQLIVDDASNDAKSDLAFKTRLMENEGLDEVKGTTERKETQILHIPGSERDTLCKIQNLLPEEKLVWLLVDKFFRSTLAGFIPFVTEEKLRERLSYCINKDENDNTKYVIKVASRFDFSYLGMLLIIMRLTYLSTTPKSNNTSEEIYILSNPIGIQFINAAQMCLNQFKLLRRGSLAVLQCSLFMRLYHKYAPEDGDGSDGGDSQAFLGLLLQMGSSIGLNRDMKHSKLLQHELRLHNLWRMVWHEIVTLDLTQSLNMGNPFLVNSNCFDTDLPRLEDNVKNNTLMDHNIWKAVVESFKTNNEINELVRGILDDILNLKEPCVLEELLPKIQKLENYTVENIGTTSWIINLEINNVFDEINKTFKLKTCIELRTALYVIHYHIYLRSGRFSSLIKVFDICVELLPMSLLITTMNNGKTNYFDELFGFGAQLLLTPYILVSLQKICQILKSFWARCLDYKYNYPKQQPRSMIIQQIHEETQRKSKIVKDCFNSLSSTYYQSWRTSKSQNVIYNLLQNESNNLFDRTSDINKECESVADEVNHFKALPQRNELNEMSINELEALLSALKYSHYEVSLKNKLKNRKTTINPTTPGFNYPSNISENGVNTSSMNSTPASNSTSGIYTKDTDLSNIEIDRLWLQMISGNNIFNDGLGSLSGDQQAVTMLGNEQDNYNLMNFDKLIGDTSPYDMLGDIPFYKER
ncbi:Thiamine repressible regulatory protein [Wickerhamomyces ciferrii]|uniref:Thiamine repressible regulatory protein n=1 Tax=Wickerhamomyces ciferrii (strain ATCC 14091 / BCRC 22168 / CBS 111 / JCM 3599 / NBRC 0793 / NRRL Y-1031 F-60-10) TaxID=1206466 RepID=K0KM23_WICCF|nr:Thiamine repressible regulatory protein [Wickerhamomyces ciferrii]CCH42419.1 Thiamine repressible regulatory protein [Wickerhamomyces ciferrii]